MKEVEQSQVGFLAPIPTRRIYIQGYVDQTKPYRRSSAAAYQMEPTKSLELWNMSGSAARLEPKHQSKQSCAYCVIDPLKCVTNQTRIQSEPDNQYLTRSWYGLYMEWKSKKLASYVDLSKNLY